MKPIIMNMKDMSDSKEVYESRPNPFFAFFIYLVLAILIVAFLWMYLAKIEIVVKGQCVVSIDGDISTITNRIDGELKESYIYDGQLVKTGDLLYTLEYDELGKQLKEYKLNLMDVEDRLVVLHAYLKVLDGQVREFDELVNNRYLNEFQVRKDLIDINLTKSNTSENKKNSRKQIILTEKNIVYGEIAFYESKKQELERNLGTIVDRISKTSITATCDGYISLNIDLVKGDYIASDTEVLTIVPENKNIFIAQIYIDNKEIGKLKYGMDVKYEIAAYPSAEYGNVKGTILSISKDIKVAKDPGGTYYLVKATMDNREFYNSTRKKGSLRLGMDCEAKIVVAKKRVLFYFLEKIKIFN